MNPSILERLLAEDLIPVVSTIGADAAGQAYNINADTVAGALAEALGAEKVIYLTDVEGLLADVDDPGQPHQPHRRRGARRRCVDDGTLTGGMIPKIAACLARRGRRRRVAPTCSTVACPTSCCSSCSATPASAP